MTEPQRLPLRLRILAALKLQPMTIVVISTCLCIRPETARVALCRLCKAGAVRRHGWDAGKRCKPYLFELVPKLSAKRKLNGESA